MKRKLISVFLSCAMLISMLPSAFAAEAEIPSNAIAVLYNEDGEIEGTYTSPEQISSMPVVDANFCLKLLKDISLPVIPFNELGYAGLSMGDDSILDLNGCILTFTGPNDSSSQSGLVMGIVSDSTITVKNGTIKMNTGGSSEDSCAYAIFKTGQDSTFENLEILSSSETTLKGAVAFAQWNAENTFTNCTIDVGDVPPISFFPAGNTSDDKILIVSGSYKNLYTDTDDSSTLPENVALKEGSTKQSIGIDSVSSDIITSPSTTALIVQDGNAYLYDTLQDAVNAASKRASNGEDGTKVAKIQLLKQPEEMLVTLPEDVPELIFQSLSTEGTPSTSIDFSKINMADSEGNTITVSEDGTTAIAVASVSLDRDSLHLYSNRGGTAQLTAKVEPDSATDKTVTWSTSDDSVATVSDTGLVTAVANGTATITAKAGDKSDTCTVYVTTYTPPANPNYKITIGDMENGSITANPTAAKAGATVTLTATPDEGYAVGTVTVTDRFGDAVRVTEQADGTYTFVMPDGQVTVNATFMASEEPAAEPFPDVDENDWFYDEVVYVYENGLMNGVENNRFAPNTATNRAMLATILYRLAGQPDVSGEMPFTDVAAGTWYTDAVLWAAQNGIVNGIGENQFGPMGTLTREQLVTMLYRYAEAEGYDVSAAADLSGYPDAGKVQPYAQEAMSWAVAEGIVEGMDGNLNPAGNATRAQIATILMRFCEGVAQ